MDKQQKGVGKACVPIHSIGSSYLHCIWRYLKQQKKGDGLKTLSQAVTVKRNEGKAYGGFYVTGYRCVKCNCVFGLSQKSQHKRCPNGNCEVVIKPLRGEEFYEGGNKCGNQTDMGGKGEKG